MMRPTKGKSRSVEALFLEAVSAGLHGQRVLWTALPPEQWFALLRLAESQKLLPILMAAVFPPAKSLEKEYPELKEHPALLPLVWQKRLLRYLKRAAASPEDRPADTVRLGNQRLELLRSYGILNE